MFLVLRLLCDGLKVRDFGLRGGVCGVALESGLHVFDALLERLEFRGSALNDLLPLIDLGIEVSHALVEAEDISQFGREGAGDCGLGSAAIGLPVPVEGLVCEASVGHGGGGVGNGIVVVGGLGRVGGGR